MSSAGQAELIINRSRFIGMACPVKSEAEALDMLESARKKYWDASHNCFAYRVGETANTARFSDDGEPGGTAGKPIMDVLTAKGLTDTLMIVTRYFGGVLLGAGGLVRAYSRCAADAVDAAGAVIMRPAAKLTLTLTYPQYNLLEQYLSSAVDVQGREYTDTVAVSLMIAESELEGFTSELTRRTDGRVSPVRAGEGYLRIPAKQP